MFYLFTFYHICSFLCQRKKKKSFEVCSTLERERKKLEQRSFRYEMILYVLSTISSLFLCASNREKEKAIRRGPLFIACISLSILGCPFLSLLSFVSQGKQKVFFINHSSKSFTSFILNTFT